MDKKPIKPIHHGIIDYGFSAVQLAGPSALGLNKKTCSIYGILGTGFLAVNMLTDSPAGVKPLISFRDHQKADAAFLSGLALLTAAKRIRKHKKSLTFHLCFLAVATANYFLTDYKSR